MTIDKSATATTRRYGWLLTGESAPDLVSANVDIPTSTVALNIVEYSDSTIKTVRMSRSYAIDVMLQLAAAIRALPE